MDGVIMTDIAETGLREAFQRIDELAKLFGLPYRPKWAQPFNDIWQEHVRLKGLCASQEATIARQKEQIERLKAGQ
jgi:hypothetical protein